jgi:hypothetical protein
MRHRQVDKRKQALKDLVTRSNTTKEELLIRLEGEKEYDHTNQKWMLLIEGKYYDFFAIDNPRFKDKQEEERFYASQISYSEEQIQEWKSKGIGIIIVN